MSEIFTLLVAVATLLSAMQSTPNVPPETQAQVLAISERVLELSMEELDSSSTDSTEKEEEEEVASSDSNNDKEDMADEVQEGSVEISFVKNGENPKAVGFGNQLIGGITVKNETNETVVYGGSLSEIMNDLGVSVASVPEEMNVSLSFLFRGEKNSQFDLTGQDGKIKAGDTATIQVRIKHAPGVAGDFVLKVGSTDHTITVETNE